MRYYLICIFLCAPCLIKAQSATEYIVIGDSLYANNENDNASLMYERAYFYSTEVQISAEAILKKVECLKKKGAFREVKQQLDKISFSILPTELHPRWHYEIAYSAFCSKEFDRAENQIKLYEALTIDSTFRKSMLFLKVVTFSNEFKWDEMNSALEQYINFVLPENNRQTYLDVASDLLNHKPKYRHPDRARLLSYIPGLGQLYAGYPIEGAFSFLLNASALSFGIYQIVNGFPFTGYFGGAGLLQAFYFGGQNRAAVLCVKKNEKNRKRFIGNVIGILTKVSKD